jgi:hypothetical protein
MKEDVRFLQEKRESIITTQNDFKRKLMAEFISDKISKLLVFT